MQPKTFVLVKSNKREFSYMAAIYCYFMIHTTVAKKTNCANYICIFKKWVNNAEANIYDLIASTRSKNVIREICSFSITFL